MTLPRYLLAVALLCIVLGVSVLNRPTIVPKHDIIQRLFHQMARWSTAATQDANLLIAMLHANYGVGYMSALRDIAGEEQIARIVGVPNIREVFAKVSHIQNDVTLRFLKECPAVMPTSELAKFGSEGF